MKTEDIINSCWLRTFTGKVIDPTNVKVSDVDIIDISAALSKLCRYGGHCNQLYTVAEHCLLVMNLYIKDAKNEYALRSEILEALLHDASEAYIVDLPTPFKNLLPEYKNLEDKITKVINKKFKLSNSINYKPYDREALEIEMSVLFDGKEDNRIKCYSPETAFALFLSTALSLMKENK